MAENPPLDFEDWQIAFEPYANNPSLAFMLAHHLIAIKDYLQAEQRNIPEAIAALDRAVDNLFEYTEFRSVSHELYRAAVEGRITIDQERAISELGIRI
jgi:hypothetical protein